MSFYKLNMTSNIGFFLFIKKTVNFDTAALSRVSFSFCTLSTFFFYKSVEVSPSSLNSASSFLSMLIGKVSLTS